MTRKEEIEKKAKIRADQYSHPVEWNDCYHHWIEGAEWADKTMINKVTDWLFKNITHRVSNGIGSGLIINFDSYSDMIEDLRKAMEE